MEEARGRAEVEIERDDDVRSDAAKVEDTRRGIYRHKMNQKVMQRKKQRNTYRQQKYEGDGDEEKDRRCVRTRKKSARLPTNLPEVC